LDGLCLGELTAPYELAVGAAINELQDGGGV
jgi:hypothetical protein